MGGGWRRIIVPLLAVALNAPSVAAQGPDRSAIALAALARESPGHRFAEAYSAIYTLPISGRGLWAGKFVDEATGAIRERYVDGDRALTPAELASAYAREIGTLSPFERKADPALRRERTLRRSDVPLSLWLDVDTSAAVDAVFAHHPAIARIGDRPAVADPTLARQIRQELYEARAAAYAAAESSLATTVRSLGGTVGYGSTSAPLLFADVPSDALDALAARSDVHAMGAADAGWSEAMAYAGPTVRSDWAYSQGHRGAGVRVADVEYYNVRNTGDLAGKVVASHNVNGSSPVYDTSGLDHPTWVAGAIASQSSTYRGTAPAAGIVSSATGGGVTGLARDQDVIAAADWAISSGDADIVNTSLGQDTSTGREQARKYFDSIVYESSRISVSAAGNHSTFGSWDVVSPGTGWNVITVGGTDDRDTAGWGDDVIWSSTDGSCYADPPGTAWNQHGDFNKPNVSAPAVTVRTANGQSASGTSVATPITAGVVAELVGRSGTFLNWPEIPRALLMAGAIHHTPMPGGSTNAAHEGVGTVDAEWSNRILDGSQYGGYAYGSLGPTGTASTFPVAKGQNVRVVLTWDSHTAGGNLSKADTLTADLDLSVDFPDGTTRRSLSFDNNYELVEYTPTASGTATIRVGATRFDAAAEDYALAWVRWPTVNGDVQPPSAPTELTASPTGPTSIALSWHASTDDLGVAGYRVSRNGSQVASVTSTSWNDVGRAPSTTYQYSVVAFDAAGNVSQPATVSATTSADVSAPTTPGNLVATATSSSAISLTWSASTDNVGVADYRIRRDGTEVAVVSATSWTDTGLGAGTTHGYSVVAEDAAHNVSALATGSATTLPADTSPPTAPSTLTATVMKSGVTKLAWGASGDDVGVAGYRVFRNGTLYTTTTGTTYSVRKQKGTFTYYVVAFDGAGNVSDPSNSVTASI